MHEFNNKKKNIIITLDKFLYIIYFLKLTMRLCRIRSYGLPLLYSKVIEPAGNKHPLVAEPMTAPPYLFLTMCHTHTCPTSTRFKTFSFCSYPSSFPFCFFWADRMALTSRGSWKPLPSSTLYGMANNVSLGHPFVIARCPRMSGSGTGPTYPVR